jgi:alpha-1,3-glucosyltransferase
VHEKSILLPLLPASLFALEEPFLLKWITLNALFSMFPLLCRDKLILPYTALSALFILICYHLPSRRQDRKETRSFNTYMTTFLVLCSVILHGVYLTNHPPRRYPFLFEAVIMLLCFLQFMLLTFNSNAKQWMLLKLKHTILMDKEKKLL